MTEIRVGAAPTIRVANKALIIRDDKLLCTVNEDYTAGYDFLMVPGGGQEWSETRIEGLLRECREEIGCDVIPGKIACMRSYIGKNHEFADWDSWFHQEEIFWFCDIVDGQNPTYNAETGDGYQTGLRWVPVHELPTSRFWPRALAVWLNTPESERELYLGDVN